MITRMHKRIISLYNFQSPPFQLNSNCPLTMSLLTFASRIGGIIDQTFLSKCTIDKKVESFIKNLKPVPASNDYLSYQPEPFYNAHVYIDPDLGHSATYGFVSHPDEFVTFGSQTLEQLGATNYRDLSARKQNYDHRKSSSIRLPPPVQKPDLIIELPAVKIPINMEAHFQDEKFNFSL
ncbi:unnamed protein product [Didymodactylos carnosus]|uniref:Uncharacterized protein n=1 Tax=Didymodactylos carnosus TaxID=1234261 RepID=A0A813S735_9BILA|nr:unnamed protein product [Didymodactylos carnosus]CAF0791062.1 unnamed protein product [Didymodactylos carnosus]CAF3500950.1 unnamed protein product [Didymodactylos carnosus]CAF3575286.1 unnamed protein product [Didymodactylos carnosus]